MIGRNLEEDLHDLAAFVLAFDAMLKSFKLIVRRFDPDFVNRFERAHGYLILNHLFVYLELIAQYLNLHTDVKNSLVPTEDLVTSITFPAQSLPAQSSFATEAVLFAQRKAVTPAKEFLRFAKYPLDYDHELLLNQIMKLLALNPSLKKALNLFLDPTRVERVTPRMDGSYLLKLKPDFKKKKSFPFKKKNALDFRAYHVAFEEQPVLYFDSSEIILIQSPKGRNSKHKADYHNNVFLYSLPKHIRNIILKNSKLLQAIHFEKVLTFGSDRPKCFYIYIEDNGRMISYSFVQTFLGNWRYGGVAERDSFRDAFNKNFGFSPV